MAPQAVEITRNGLANGNPPARVALAKENRSGELRIIGPTTYGVRKSRNRRIISLLVSPSIDFRDDTPRPLLQNRPVAPTCLPGRARPQGV
jgi:hypothetical protein